MLFLIRAKLYIIANLMTAAGFGCLETKKYFYTTQQQINL